MLLEEIYWKRIIYSIKKRSFYDMDVSFNLNFVENMSSTWLLKRRKTLIFSCATWKISIFATQ